MGSMQGPGPAQGQDAERAQTDPNMDNNARLDELNAKIERGETLTQEEQQELNRINAEAENPGAPDPQQVEGTDQGQSQAQKVGKSDDQRPDNQPGSKV